MSILHGGVEAIALLTKWRETTRLRVEPSGTTLRLFMIHMHGCNNLEHNGSKPVSNTNKDGAL